MTLTEPANKADLIDGLVRGVAVLNAFNREQPQHTASSLAAALDMSRAAARRFLITLDHLGLAATDGRAYWLTPKILSFAHNYQSSEQLVRTVQPHVQALMKVVGETVTFGVIDGDDVLYLSRATGPKMLTTNIGPGSRLPLQCAAAGWAIMAHWPTVDFTRWLNNVTLHKYTPHSLVNKKALEKRMLSARTEGYVLLESQFELGMRGMSAAVMNSSGKIAGGLTIAMAASVCSTEEAEERFARPLKEAAAKLANYL
jgi:IclR family transcriptional regulator, pca regulon regulatory protein